MPKSVNGDTNHPGLRAWLHHHFDLALRGGHGIGDCPFCNHEGKLSIDAQTSQWQCWSCQSHGNALTFLRQWYNGMRNNKEEQNGFADVVASDRRLSPDTVAAWGVVQGLDRTWLLPGYSPSGEVYQLYRRTHFKDSEGKWYWRLIPTPGVWDEGKAHGLHLVPESFDSSLHTIFVCEGPWDGMALWQTQQATGQPKGNVIAVPGCNVWRDEWTELCRGKHVVLLYDSDYPRQLVGGKVSRPGYDGMRRVAWKLSGSAASVKYVKWGDDGYDASRPDGWDVRDQLTSGDDPASALLELLEKVADVPADWFSAESAVTTSKRATSTEARDCSTWQRCEESWKEAMRWRQELSDALAVLLAVCASTKQSGNQLYVDLVGSPGSAKTTMCRGLLVSRHCIHFENATKLLSGYKKAGEEDKDCSFIARANGKTWITCEFDTLASSHEYHQLMGKARRIFDGETSATYGNRDEDRVYTALRTPWIRAGTPKMMDHDQSQLGDRFIRFILTDPDNHERREIARRAMRAEVSAMMEVANNMAGSLVDAETRLAHALTGGYVDWLRSNVETLLPTIQVSEETEDRCLDMAELSSDLRARPQVKPKHKDVHEPHECKELPTRLSRQYMRLARCLAVVLNKNTVDDAIMCILRKVALDTAHGHSLSIAQWLCAENPDNPGRSYQDCGGIGEKSLAVWTGMNDDRVTAYLMFLRRIGVAEYRSSRRTGGTWMLTDRVYDLYRRVVLG